MRATHLDLLRTVSAPTVHPSTTFAVVALTRPDLAADTYVGQLWRVPLDGAAPHRLTRGFLDTAPRFSPDGRLLAFLRTLPGAAPQLAIVPAGGGEPMVITDAKLGVREFAFNADGSRIAFVAAVPEPGRHGTLADVGAPQEDPRHITTVQFQENGVGYAADQRTHLFVVEVPDPYGE
ncbi:MAG: S9 family peptidase, partial [Propionicimonas sp.]